MLLLGTFFINSTKQDKVTELIINFAALMAVLHMDDIVLKFGALSPLQNLYEGRDQIKFTLNKE